MVLVILKLYFLFSLEAVIQEHLGGYKRGKGLYAPVADTDTGEEYPLWD